MENPHDNIEKINDSRNEREEASEKFTNQEEFDAYYLGEIQKVSNHKELNVFLKALQKENTLNFKPSMSIELLKVSIGKIGRFLLQLGDKESREQMSEEYIELEKTLESFK